MINQNSFNIENLTLENVKPGDFNIKEHFYDSPLRKYEKELVARNIISLAARNNNEWFSFSWEDYYERCYYDPSFKEHCVLYDLTQDGLIKNEKDVYYLQNKFVQVFAQFLKEDVVRKFGF